jgi:Xaa-Pro aminopeptidase
MTFLSVRRTSVFVFCTVLILAVVQNNLTAQPAVLSLKERAATRDRILEERLREVLPPLMKRTGIDLWIVSGREYNEDPVLKTMLPATWINARRRTILVLRYRGDAEPVEALAVARYDVGTMFKRAWDPEKQPDQLKRLTEIIAERNPAVIGINSSAEEALADGLTRSESDALMAALPGSLQKRVKSAEDLAVGWLETRSATEQVIFETAAKITHHIIAEVFSDATVTPGVTTTSDLQWAFREKAAARGLQVWFHPTVDVQRASDVKNLYSFASKPDAEMILPGDVLHCDFGIEYLGLHTDVQRLAYVCKPGEKDAPAGLKEALQKGNEAQDILTAQFRTGRTGNQILSAALAEGKAQNNRLTVYSHPLGLHGHAAGPTIGLWDNQKDVPGGGDYPLYPKTGYAIELNTLVFIKDWNKDLRVMLEECAFFDGITVRYMNERQTAFYLVGAAGSR